MSRIGGDGVNSNTFETINAAATAIAAAENRNTHATLQKRRWGCCWSLWGCFGSPKSHKRIVHAVLVPEPSVAARADALSAQNPIQAPSIVFPFVAPPSSPVSFFNSEPPSSTHSPASGLSLNANSASMYSPSGPASGFVIGPYAHETQLVTPPTFSTFTTEPSTAPFTPPPESVHMTTPSSPEVPFAKLLDSYNKNGVDSQRFPLSQYEFQSYFLQPGSPVSHLISPSSGISGSGTSSPLPDEFFPGRLHFLDIRSYGNSKFSKLEKMDPPGWASQKGSGTLTPEPTTPGTPELLQQVDQNSDAPSLANAHDFQRYDENVVDHRVSFEVTAEVIRCAEKKPAAIPTKPVLPSIANGICVAAARKDNNNRMDLANGHQTCCSGETSCSASNNIDALHRQRSPTLGSGKEFNFDNIDGVNSERVSDWWANEKVIGDEGGDGKSWSFFPVMQPGVR